MILMLLLIMMFILLHLLLLHLIQILILLQNVKQMQLLMLMQMQTLNSFMLQLLMLFLQHQWHTTSILHSARTIQRGNARKFLSKLPARWLHLTVSQFLYVCQSHAHTAQQLQDLSLSKCAMTGQSLSVSRYQPRSLSRYLCRSVVRYQGKCASQYTRRFQGSTVLLAMVIIEDTRQDIIFINLCYC